MKEISNKKIILQATFYILSFLILFLVFLLSDKVDFIPVFNNVLLGLAVLLFFAYQIFFINKFTELRINFYLKLIVILVLIGIGFFAGYIILLMSIFAIKDNVGFSYDGESYYILNEGWIDEDLVIYKKKFITMDRMNFDLSKKTFKDFEKITNEDAKTHLKSYFYKDQDLKPYQISKENKLVNKNLNKQEILNELSLEDAKKIPNSSYGIVEVDRAGARSRWFFVEIINNKLNLISELPDTSPDISGEIIDDGSILIICKDLNGNIKKYKSVDAGKTFVPFN